MKIYFLGILLITGLFWGCGSSRKSVKTFERPQSRDKAWDYYMKGVWDEFEYRYQDALLNYYMASSFDSTNAAIHEAIADNEMHLEIYDVALLFLDRALKQEPDNERLLMKKGKLLVRTGELDKAYAIFKQLFIKRPRHYLYQYMVQNLLKSVQDEKEIEWFYQYRADHIGDRDSYIALGQYFYSHERLGSAREIFEELNRRFPDDDEIIGSLAEIYLRLGEKQKAIPLLEKALLNSGNTKLLYALTELYHETGQEHKIEPFLNKFTLQFPNEFRHSSILLADSYFRNKQFKKAVLWLKYHRDKVENPSRAYYDMLARSYFSLDEADSSGHTYMDSARMVLESALKKFNKEENFWLLYALTFTQTGDLNRALVTLRKCEPMFPQSVRLLGLHAQILFQLNKTEEMIVVLNRLLKVQPENNMALGLLANYYMDQQNYTIADSLYKKAISFYPEDPLFLNNYAYALAQRGIQLQKALEMINRALTKEPQNAAYLDTKGWILFKMGEYEKAEKLIRAAVDKDQNDGDVLDHMGDVLWKLNRKQEARQYWQKAADKINDNSTILLKIRQGL